MKKIIIVLLIIFSLLFLSFIVYEHFIFKNSIPILAYHKVLENPLEETDVSIKNFEAQMKYLSLMGYQTLSLDEFYEFKNGKDIKGKKVLLTFDDGMENFYTTVIPILNKYNFKAVNFVINFATDQNNHLTSEQINSINNSSNYVIENHSFNLHNEKSARSNNYELYKKDFELTKKHNYKYYAYPFGIKNENYEKVLKDYNYKLAFLYSPSKWSNRNQFNYAITRVPIYKSNSLLKFIIKVSFKI